MANRNKVMKGLECCALGDCSPCPYTETRCQEHLCGDALVLLKEQSWIPATNPPKETGRYLVTILEAGEYMSAEAAFIESSEVWRDPVEEYEHYNHVVAWMPLPEPYRPKEE